MTCKYLYMNLGCNHPHEILVEDGKILYPVCGYWSIRDCPYYEDKDV